MEEDTVVRLPRPRASIVDDALLDVLRSAARRMLQQVIEAESRRSLRRTLSLRTLGAVGVWCGTVTRLSARSRSGSARSRYAGRRCATAATVQAVRASALSRDRKRFPDRLCRSA